MPESPRRRPVWHALAIACFALTVVAVLVVRVVRRPPASIASDGADRSGQRPRLPHCRTGAPAVGADRRVDHLDPRGVRVRVRREPVAVLTVAALNAYDSITIAKSSTR